MSDPTKNTRTLGNTTLDADGNIGIGTNVPTHKLHVYASSSANNEYGAAGVLLQNAGSGEVGLGLQSAATGTNAWVLGLNSNSTRFDIGYGMETEQIQDADVRIAILESGNVGIGTTLPRSKLDVAGTLTATTYSNLPLASASAPGIVQLSTSTGDTSTSTAATPSAVKTAYDLAADALSRTLGGTVQADVSVIGTITASNLRVVGDTTVMNTYVTQNSNVRIINETGSGPALYVSQKGSGLEYAIAEFYDPDVSTVIPAFKIAEGGNIGIRTSQPQAALDIWGTIRNSNLTPSTVLVADASRHIVSSTIPTTKLEYLGNVTSDVQTQLDAKQPTIIGAATTITSTNLAASKVVVSDVSGKVVASELHSSNLPYLANITGGVQAQIDSKQATLEGAATSIAFANLTSSRVVVSDVNGKIAVSTVSSNEVEHLVGVTSSIQQQLNSKQATISGAATTITSANLATSKVMVSDVSGKVATSSLDSSNLDYLSGVTSDIQTQLNAKQPTIFGAATTITSADLPLSKVVVSDGSGKVVASSLDSSKLTFLSNVTSDIQGQLNAMQSSITGAASTIISSNLTESRVVVSDASGKIATSSITSNELGYLQGVTSSVQQQINSKQATITGAATSITSNDLALSKALVSDASGKVAASSVTSSELGYVSGVTSSIQTQMDGKQATITGGASSIASANLTITRALVSDGSGKVTVSSVTSNEMEYLAGVTSAVQTQLDAKQATITGAASSVTGTNLTTSKVLVSDVSGKISASLLENSNLDFLSNVTSDIQTQLNAKQVTITGAATTITSINLDTSRALVSDGAGKVAVSPVTSNELGYLSGVTSSIQTQLNAKQATITGAATSIAALNLTASKVVVSDASGKVSASTLDSAQLVFLSNVTSDVQEQIQSKMPLTGGTLSGNMTVQGTITTSNLNVLGSATTINSYVSQTSNVSIINSIGTGPALYVSQAGVGFQQSIAEFYDPEVSTTVPVMKIAEGGNVGLGTTLPLRTLHVEGDINFTGSLFQSNQAYVSSQWTSSGNDISFVSGNIGIGTTASNVRLLVSGDTQIHGQLIASNILLTTFPYIQGYPSAVISGLQPNPVNGFFEVTGAGDSNFVLQTVGLYGVFASNTQIYYNGSKLSYLSDTAKDYDVAFTNGATTTEFQVTLYVDGLTEGDLVDVTIWPSMLEAEQIRPGAIIQYLSEGWRSTGDRIFTFGNVGIGTSTPLARTHVYHTGTGDAFRVDDETAPDTTPFLIQQDGNVGIGTTVAQTGLHVAKNAGFGNQITTSKAERALNLVADNAVMRVWRVAAVGADPAVELVWGQSNTPASQGNYYWDFYIRSQDGSFNVRDRTFGRGSAIRWTVTSNGDIGIGTQSPQAKMHMIHTGTGDALRIDDGASPDTTPFVINADGNVGIGLSIPAHKLQVGGDIVPGTCNIYDLGTSNLRWRDLYLSGNTIDIEGLRLTRTSNNALSVSDGSGVLQRILVKEMQLGDSVSGNSIVLKLDQESGNVKFVNVDAFGQEGSEIGVSGGISSGIGWSNLDTSVFLLNSNVGIGTTFAHYPLDVVGTIRATQYLGLPSATTSASGIVQLSTSTNDTSTTTAATPSAVKSAYDLAAGALSRSSGGVVTSDVVVQGTITASNLNVLGSVTTMNAYVTQNSNVSIINTTGSGPALYVSQTGVGLGFPIAEFYDPDVSTINPVLKIAEGGNIGIGTHTPTHKLHLHSSESQNDNYEATGVMLENASGGEVAIAFRNSNVAADNNSIWGIGLNSNSSRFDVVYGSQTSQMLDTSARLSIIPNGNVGIGRTNPAFGLDVATDIRTKFMNITTDGLGGQIDLLRFETLRPWVFRATGTGASTNLQFASEPDDVYLQSTVGAKTFSIVDSSGSNIAQFRDSGSSAPFVQIGANTSYTNPSLRFAASTGLNMPATNVMSFITNTTSRMVINASGYVGVGTTSPTHRLHVYDSNSTNNNYEAASLMLQNDGSGEVGMAIQSAATSTNAWFIGLNSNSPRLDIGYGLQTSQINDADAKISISTDGNVGIGTTNTSAHLTLYKANDVRFDLFDSGVSSGGSGSSLVRFHGGRGTIGWTSFMLQLAVLGGTNTITFATNGSERVRISSTGNVGIGTTLPLAFLHTLTSGSEASARFENSSSAMSLDIIGNGTSAKTAFSRMNVSGFFRGAGMLLEATNTNSKWWIGNPYQGANGAAGSTNDGCISIGQHTHATDAQPEYSANSKVVVHSTGFVGIGTFNPSHRLHVYGSNTTDNNYESSGILIENGATGEAGLAIRTSNMGTNAWIIGTNSNQTRLDFSYGDQTTQINDASVDVTILENGNVGIGTTNPLTKLSLYSTTNSDGLNLTTTEWGVNIVMRANANNTKTGRRHNRIEFMDAGNTISRIQTTNGENAELPFALRLNGVGIPNNITLVEGGGNVGVGTNAPTHKLHVYGSNTTDNNYESSGILIENAARGEAGLAIRTSNMGTNAWIIGTNSNQTRLDFAYGDQTTQINDASVDVTILENGNVGIGTTNPSHKLHVTGNALVGAAAAGTTSGFQGGPFFRQQSWDTAGTSHTIAYPTFCMGNNSAGTLFIQVSNKTVDGVRKLGNMQLSFLRSDTTTVIFEICNHISLGLGTFQAAVSGNDVVITTDSDCAISWTSTGSW